MSAWQARKSLQGGAHQEIRERNSRVISPVVSCRDFRVARSWSRCVAGRGGCTGTQKRTELRRAEGNGQNGNMYFHAAGQSTYMLTWFREWSITKCGKTVKFRESQNHSKGGKRQTQSRRQASTCSSLMKEIVEHKKICAGLSERTSNCAGERFALLRTPHQTVSAFIAADHHNHRYCSTPPRYCAVKSEH